MSRVLQADQVPAGASIFSLADFERAAADIIACARKQAQALSAAASAEAVQVRERAQREGWESGHRQGLEAGTLEGSKSGRDAGLAEIMAGTATVGAALESLVGDLASRRAALLKEAERDLLGLALGIAEKVIRREIAVDVEVARRALSEAVSLAADRSRVTVRLHPVDLEGVRAVLPDITARLVDIKDVELLADETVERGGCLLVTAAGEVDLRVGTQIDRIAQLLLGIAQDVHGADAGGGGG